MADYIGWIKIHREIQNHWIYKIDGEYSKYHAWSDLLLNANFKDTKIVIKGTVIELSKGQQARSVLTLVKHWGWSKNKVLRFLDLLKNDGMIDVKTNHLTSIITICNYSSFQNGDTTGETPNDTTGETPHDTPGDTQYKKVKKEKNDKEDKKDITPPAKAVATTQQKSTLSKNDLVTIGFDAQLAEDYLTLRKAKKLPLTKTALINIVHAGAEVGLNPNQTLTYCINSSWAGFKKEWYLKDNQAGQRVSVISDFLRDPDFDF